MSGTRAGLTVANRAAWSLIGVRMSPSDRQPLNQSAAELTQSLKEPPQLLNRF